MQLLYFTGKIDISLLLYYFSHPNKSYQYGMVCFCS